MEADIEMGDPMATTPTTTTALTTTFPKSSRSASCSSQVATLEILPDEVFGDFFSYLPFSFIVRCLSLINRKWYNLVYSQVHCASFRSKEINRESGIQDVVANVQKFQSLAKLTLTDFETGVDESHAKGILSRCGMTLRRLVIENCQSITSVDLTGCTSLQHLSFTGCEKLAQIQVNEASCHRLETIDLSNTKITDENLCSILSFVTPRILKRLILVDCSELTRFPAFAEILAFKESQNNNNNTSSSSSSSNNNSNSMMQTSSFEDTTVGLSIPRAASGSSTSLDTNLSNLATTPTKSVMYCSASTPIKSTSMFRLEKLDLSYCFKIRMPEKKEPQHETNQSPPVIKSDFDSSNNGDSSSLVITDLILRRTLVNDDQFQELTQTLRFNRLKSLNIYGCLYLRAPRFGSRTLQTLDISHSRIEDDSLRYIIFNCPNLQVVKLFNCRELHSPIVENESITTLDFGFCAGLAQPHISCPALEDLSLRNTEISDAVLEKVLSHSSSRLRILTLSQCNNLENPEINCSTLETLSMNACDSLDSPVLTNCANLKSINISETKITDSSLETMLNEPQLLNLQSLDIRWCPNIRNAKIPPHVVAKRS